VYLLRHPAWEWKWLPYYAQVIHKREKTHAQALRTWVLPLETFLKAEFFGEFPVKPPASAGFMISQEIEIVRYLYFFVQAKYYATL
jgi:hypothetical protein